MEGHFWLCSCTLSLSAPHKGVTDLLALLDLQVSQELMALLGRGEQMAKMVLLDLMGMQVNLAPQDYLEFLAMMV